MSVDNNGKEGKDIKNILAFALIVIIAIIIAFFNWSKGLRTSNTNKTKEENKSKQEIESNIQEIKNILNNGIKDLKNISNSQQQENEDSGYGHSYGYSDVDYDTLLKNIKPEDIEQYIIDSNEIDNTLKNEEQSKTE